MITTKEWILGETKYFYVIVKIHNSSLNFWHKRTNTREWIAMTYIKSLRSILINSSMILWFHVEILYWWLGNCRSRNPINHDFEDSSKSSNIPSTVIDRPLVNMKKADCTSVHSNASAPANCFQVALCISPVSCQLAPMLCAIRLTAIANTCNVLVFINLCVCVTYCFNITPTRNSNTNSNKKVSKTYPFCFEE